MSVAPRPHITRSPGCAAATSSRISGSPGASQRGGKLSITGTVSRCPASTTRRGLPSDVDATTVSPCLCTVRCGFDRRNASTASASGFSSSLTEYESMICSSSEASAFSRVPVVSQVIGAIAERGSAPAAAIVVVVVMLTILTAARPVGARCRDGMRRPNSPSAARTSARRAACRATVARETGFACVMRQNLAKHMRMAVWGLPANGKGMGICRVY